MPTIERDLDMNPEPTEDPTVAPASPLLPVSEEANFLRLFDAAAVALALVDDAHHITRVNPAWVELLGYSADQALNMKLEDVVAARTQSVALPDWDVRTAATTSRMTVVRADGTETALRYGALASVIKGAHLIVFAPDRPTSAPGSGGRRHRTGKLTRRERESLRLVAQGMTTTVAAGQLGISPETVRTHVRNAMNKLGARTRAQAIAVALRDGEMDD
jgi:PAS domain S-box-containing protein